MEILVVQTAFLGDIVLTTPLLREIKRANPGSRTTVATTPLGAALLAGHPAVDALHVLDKRGATKGPLGMLTAVRELRGKRFDVSIAAQRSSRTGLIVRFAGGLKRVGFGGAAGQWAYTDRVKWDGAVHAVHRYLALAGPLGGRPDADPQPMLAVHEAARSRIHKLLGDGDDLLAISPGSIWGTKRWTPEGFAAVARSAKDMGLRPVLVGSPDEADLCRSIADLAGGVPVLAGTTNIPDLVALLARSKALVVNDSGPGHVASAVGTPVVAIFGPTVPAFGYTPFGPRNMIVENPGLECRPCDRHGPQVCPLRHHRCMTEIPPARVVDALAQIVRPG
ncbi:MAG TPA: lipopolysaccharide heptosyltransferase II [Candidatus Polarisedimenticolaceae bacterium]|nr:lipopolysaccharide heptosyltransferase II [Candidatus Polarisedimenticolaceae bacterium]